MGETNDIRKLKIFDKLVIWTSRNKMHVKDLDKPEEHGTMGFLPNGEIDIHRKNEKSNEYQSEGILDLRKLLTKFTQDPLQFLSPLLQMANNVKVVNFDENDLSHLSVSIFPDINTIVSVSKKKNKSVEIPVGALDVLNNLEKLPWNDCKGKDFQGGIVYNANNMVGFIQRTESGGYLLVPLNEQTNSVIKNLESSWFTLDPPNWKPDKE